MFVIVCVYVRDDLFCNLEFGAYMYKMISHDLLLLARRGLLTTICVSGLAPASQKVDVVAVVFS